MTTTAAGPAKARDQQLDSAGSRRAKRSANHTKRSDSSGHTARDHDLHAVYRLQAEICRAMGHPLRIQILDLLSTGERTGTDLRRLLGVGKVNLSQHLSVMKQAGLIRSRQRGREALHSLAIREITSACQLIRTVLATRLQQGLKLARTLKKSGSPFHAFED